MSGRDEFDPEIERLFSRPMALDNAQAFTHRVSQRLRGEWRVRTLALSVAGAIGGLAALRQALGGGVTFLVSDTPAKTTAVLDNAVRDVSGQITDVLGQTAPLVELSALSGMQAFWLLSLGLIASAAVVALRAVDEA